MKRSIFTIFFIYSSFFGFAQQSCNELPEYWKSENEAVTVIEHATFKYSETINNQDSWLKKASFYSCDGVKGYLLIYSEKNVALHQDVPMKVWEMLKEAKSKGGYYNFYLKEKFKLKEPT